MTKNIKHILFAAGAMLLAVSCQDYLTEPPVGSLSPNGFYTTPAHVESGVLGIYNKLLGVEADHYILCSEDRSDNMWADSNPNGTRTCSEISFLRVAESTSEFASLWAGWYSLIYNANTVLANIDAVEFTDEATKNQFKGEALFLRALAHFELARVFGNVPIVDHNLSSVEAKELAQSDAATVIKTSVVPDLKEAEGLLPYRASMKSASGSAIASEGRADKLAAQALLARVYMTLKGWPYNDSSAKSEAQSYLDKVLQNGSSYFAPSIDEWKKQWLTDNTAANKYQIFAIQHRNDTGNQVTFIEGVGIDNPTIVKDSYHSGNGMTSVYPEGTLRYEYVSNNDPRGLGFYFIDGYEAYEASGVPAYSTNVTEFQYNGETISSVENAINIKFCPTIPKRQASGITFDDTSLGTGTSSRNKWPLNFPLIRFEDMMLLRAELYVEDGQVSQAMALVNQIRQRAGVPARAASASADQAMKWVRLERQLELYLEGVRWFDQIRYGEWMTSTRAKWDNYKIGGAYRANVSLDNLVEGRYLCPIPATEIEASSNLYKQNPGW